MKIRYFVKQVFGNSLMYVLRPAQAEAISKISGKQTLTQETMQGLAALGLQFEQVLDPAFVKQVFGNSLLHRLEKEDQR